MNCRHCAEGHDRRHAFIDMTMWGSQAGLPAEGTMASWPPSAQRVQTETEACDPREGLHSVWLDQFWLTMVGGPIQTGTRFVASMRARTIKDTVWQFCLAAGCLQITGKHANDVCKRKWFNFTKHLSYQSVVSTSANLFHLLMFHHFCAGRSVTFLC